VPPREFAERWPGIIVALHAMAFWPVWRWYVERLNDGSDEPWGLAALAAAAFVGWPARRFILAPRDRLLGIAALLTLLYAACAPFAPPLVRALLAMSALACTWTSIADARAKFAAVLVLLVLSMPVIASLQFYAGYPLRVVTASGATALLHLARLDVVRDGTSMAQGGRTVLVDAPCSGVRMLWTAAALCCVLAAHRARVTFAALAMTGAFAFIAVLAANSVRAALLFLLETRPTPPAHGWHACVGAGAFALVALLLVAFELAHGRVLARTRRTPRISMRPA
jgi:exosortase/archaeosortase family protein